MGRETILCVVGTTEHSIANEQVVVRAVLWFLSLSLSVGRGGEYLKVSL